MAELAQHDEDQENQLGLKVAQQTISNLQARLSQKEEVVKKYQNMLARARQVSSSSKLLTGTSVFVDSLFFC